MHCSQKGCFMVWVGTLVTVALFCDMHVLSCLLTWLSACVPFGCNLCSTQEWSYTAQPGFDKVRIYSVWSWVGFDPLQTQGINSLLWFQSWARQLVCFCSLGLLRSMFQTTSNVRESAWLVIACNLQPLRFQTKQPNGSNQTAQWFQSNNTKPTSQACQNLPTKPVQSKTESTNQEPQPHAKANVKQAYCC